MDSRWGWGLPPNVGVAKTAPAMWLPLVAIPVRSPPAITRLRPVRFNLPAPSQKAGHGTLHFTRRYSDFRCSHRLVDVPLTSAIGSLMPSQCSILLALNRFHLNAQEVPLLSVGSPVASHSGSPLA